ncbi:hypothetical protein FOA52_004094 [Chlamydomonas sp. UWO 241]|nr:hypothetical protein FOA52_004094 [Chlamydomonas sp. UWO 241]
MKASTQYALYWTSLGHCAAGWCVQLGGLAALQANCTVQHHLEDNDVRPVITLLEASKVALTQILTMAPGGAQTAAMAAFIGKSYPGVLSSIKTLTSRSSTAVFTLTPDTDCGHYYRYLWVNTALQFAVCAFVAFALLARMHQRTAAAVCALLSLVTLLAIQNIHTSFYVQYFLPELVPTEAYVFLCGCVITAVFNVTMIVQHGTQDAATATITLAGNNTTDVFRKASVVRIPTPSFKFSAHPDSGAKTSEDSGVSAA